MNAVCVLVTGSLWLQWNRCHWIEIIRNLYPFPSCHWWQPSCFIRKGEEFCSPGSENGFWYEDTFKPKWGKLMICLWFHPPHSSLHLNICYLLITWQKGHEMGYHLYQQTFTVWWVTVYIVCQLLNTFIVSSKTWLYGEFPCKVFFILVLDISFEHVSSICLM